MNALRLLVSVLLAGAGILAGGGCLPEQNKGASTPPGPEVPNGFVPEIQLVHKGSLLNFGPFVGYYFAPAKSLDDLEHLHFICFNERGFYASDAPVNATLFEGEARLVTLPDVGRELPATDRINPVFFSDAPQAWLDTRPKPQIDYRHFHSCHDATGPIRTGYWLKHVAKAEFTYDMGGRVTPQSSLYHKVTPGIDQAFATIIEFDKGEK